MSAPASLPAAPAEPFGATEFDAAANVSRETLARLSAYVELLCRWNPKINLVGHATLKEVWRRHILDSAQLIEHIPASSRILVDLGSGAGLPGLILAILGIPETHLVESDQRKCAFLREAACVTQTKVTIQPHRIENIAPIAADIVTARALAPLTKLLEWAAPFIASHTICLFPKGKSLEDELTEARRAWIMKTQKLASQSDEASYILRVEELSHAPDGLPK